MKKALIITLSLVSSIAFAAKDMHHDNMDHDSMGHGKIDHSQMDHGKMDHSMMNMSGMSAVGMQAKGAKADKVVHVILSDDKPIQFKKSVDIKPNDVVQFVVMNTGSKAHEFAIGSERELAKHGKMMQQMAGMEHDTNNSIIVEAKKARQFMWHFHGDNQVRIDCNIKGHDQHGQPLELTL
ncbi:hypothetical protein JCM19238_1309 [Vibrio ponticus]|nr:hypothetical protein JCM19238_1309 [Vibrio ponticus]